MIQSTAARTPTAIERQSTATTANCILLSTDHPKGHGSGVLTDAQEHKLLAPYRLEPRLEGLSGGLGVPHVLELTAVGNSGSDDEGLHERTSSNSMKAGEPEAARRVSSVMSTSLLIASVGLLP